MDNRALLSEAYRALADQLAALTDGETNLTANLANASAAIFHALEGLNWAGFYCVENKQNGEKELVLGPFQGKPACIRIPFGRGVCGTAAAQDAVQLVKNVHEFPGHIACDGASASEIVIPLHSGGRVAAVLDLDSPLLGRFHEEDRIGLEACAAVLEKNCSWELHL